MSARPGAPDVRICADHTYRVHGPQNWPMLVEALNGPRSQRAFLKLRSS